MGGGGGAPMVSGETPITLDEERTVPELLAPSLLLPRSDKDDSSGNKINDFKRKKKVLNRKKMVCTVGI